MQPINNFHTFGGWSIAFIIIAFFLVLFSNND